MITIIILLKKNIVFLSSCEIDALLITLYEEPTKAGKRSLLEVIKANSNKRMMSLVRTYEIIT